MSEFELIRGPIAKLARDPAALGLADDAALLPAASAGMGLVIAKDAIVEGVHFIGDEPPDAIAAKLMRVNLSDLAAMGARPRHYLTAAAFPSARDRAWREAFVEGLAREQALFSVSALGGDLVSSPGPMVFSMTMIGEVEQGAQLTRSGAQPGDDLWVSGTLGDAALGLEVARRGAPSGEDEARLLERYRRPRPRLELGRFLIGLASAAMDVSDGLAGDLEHILRASGVGCALDLDALPLSPAAQGRAGAREAALSGGDDYELLFTAPRSARARLAMAPVEVRKIGVIRAEPGLWARDAAGALAPIEGRGHVHR